MAIMTIVLPDELDDQRGLGPDWGRWLDSVPRLFADLLDEWNLTHDVDDLWHGFCSLVAPVVTDDGTRAVLKISFDGDDESVHEGLALQHWHGDGTVRLLRADPHRRALLLERLERRDLNEMWDLEACETVAGLYPKIHLPALPQLATVTSYVSRWLDELAAQPHDIPIPSRYREQALSLGRRPGRRPGQRRTDHPRRPALRERAGRRPASTPSGGSGWSSTPSRCPATRTTSSRRCCGTATTSWLATSGTGCAAASTLWSTTLGSTRTVPTTG